MGNYDRAAHLAMIQGIINRMGANSLQCKTWAMMIFSALAVVLIQSNDAFRAKYICFLVLFMLFAFCFLDSWYLQMERRFRHLYNDIRKKPDTEDPEEFYAMNYRSYPEQCIFRIMFSLSEWPVYLLPVIFTVIILYNAVS